MKKSLFYTLGAIGIMALIALNVYVVTSKETPAFLKWDAMSYIFANGNSGSGSGSSDKEPSYSDSVWNVSKHCEEDNPYITCYQGGSSTCLIADHCPKDDK